MLEIARRPAKKGLTDVTDSIPAHLALARSQIGKYQDGPSILPLAAKIGELYPEMAGYCRLVVPTTSWCGLFCGHDLAVNGIRPPYNPKVDTQSFLWARAWLNYGTPVQRGQEQPGDILVFDFGGGDSHVTFHNGDSGSNYLCLGGNRSFTFRRGTAAYLDDDLGAGLTVRAPPRANVLETVALDPVHDEPIRREQPQ